MHEPKSLHDLCALVVAISGHLRSGSELVHLPDRSIIAVFFDSFKSVRETVAAYFLFHDIHKWSFFRRLLHCSAHGTKTWLQLLRIFQCFSRKRSFELAGKLTCSYIAACVPTPTHDDDKLEKLIEEGLQLGLFFRECGWYKEAEEVYTHCAKVAAEAKRRKEGSGDCVNFNLLIGKSHVGLMAALNANDKLLESKEAFSQAMEAFCAVERPSMETTFWTFPGGMSLNYAELFAHGSVASFGCGDYGGARMAAELALKLLDDQCHPRTKHIVILQLGRVSLFLHEFPRAYALLKAAVRNAIAAFGFLHPVYTDVLTVFADFYLHIAMPRQSDRLRVMAVLFLLSCFDTGESMRIAKVFEQLAEFPHSPLWRRHVKPRVYVNAVESMVTPIGRHDRLLRLLGKGGAAEAWREEGKTTTMKRALELALERLRAVRIKEGDASALASMRYFQFGKIYDAMGHHDAAKYMYEKVIEIRTLLFGFYDIEIASANMRLACLYGRFKNGTNQEIRTCIQRSKAIKEKLLGNDSIFLEVEYFYEIFQESGESAGTQNFTEWRARVTNLKLPYQSDAEWRFQAAVLGCRIPCDCEGQCTCTLELSIEDVKRTYHDTP